jgi:hypothetical protein
MNELIPIALPVAEPVNVEAIASQLGLTIPDDDVYGPQLTTRITNLATAARIHCENYTRSCFITSTWLYQRDGWPPRDLRYEDRGQPGAFLLPRTPFQSIVSFNYVNEDGNICPLALDTSYGTNVSEPMYGYQLDPGTDTRPARLSPRWATPWPPLRWVPNAVQIQFKAGYGGPVTAAMAASSAVLTGPVFDQGDVGQAVSVPAAGAAGAALTTTIASVDNNGQATLTAEATTAVASAANNVWVGQQVPSNIIIAILLMTQFLFEQGGSIDMPTPSIVADMLEFYRNRTA